MLLHRLLRGCVYTQMVVGLDFLWFSGVLYADEPVAKSFSQFCCHTAE